MPSQYMHSRVVAVAFILALSDPGLESSVLASDLSVETFPVQSIGTGNVGFSFLKSTQTGVVFRNDLEPRKGAANRVLFNGSGVAVGDLDEDGRPDLFFCGIDSPNHLYRNLGGWEFKRIPIPEALARPGAPSRGVVFADLDGDGFLDILLSTVGRGVRVFFNHGDFHFRDHTDQTLTGNSLAASSMALADVDGNGTLDLYVANNRTNDIRDRARVPIKRVGGRILPPDDLRDRIFIHEGQLHEYGERDLLYLNDGEGHMASVSWTNGGFREAGQDLKEAPRDWGLSAMFRDINGDGHPDLYVCNDYWTPDRLWINDGTGGFDAATAGQLAVTSLSSMGVDGSDIDQDGDLDLLVVDMLSRDPKMRKRQQPAANMVADMPSLNGARRQVNWNTLLVARHHGHFSELAHFAGLEASDWSWSPIFIDVDLDGFQDVLVSAGYPHDMQDIDTLLKLKSRQHAWGRYSSESARQQAFTDEMMEHIRMYPRLSMPVVAFRNLRDGTFQEMTAAWGTHRPAVHQGFATGDLDGDGDLDLVLNCLNGPACLYRNDTSAPRVLVQLTDATSNTQAAGARLILHQPSMSSQSREILVGGRYLSGSDTAQVFAVDPAAGAASLEIWWRDGNRSVLKDIRANMRYHIHRRVSTAEEAVSPAEQAPALKALFQDASELLQHRSPSAPSNDLLGQPLLPWSLSYHGPGIVCCDFNRDGRADIAVGVDRGQRPSVFYGQADASFDLQQLSIPLWNDTAGMLGLPVANGAFHLMFGLNGYEIQERAALVEFNLRGQRRSLFSRRLPGAACMAAGPLGGRGAISLFAGGFAKAGRYPASHPSLLLNQTDQGWAEDMEHDDLMQKMALPQGAVWSDLTADGYPELVVATEWGPLRVFENQQGMLRERTQEWGFHAFHGLWKGVASGDMDGNGFPDLLVGNWGHNSPWHAHPSEPLQLFHGQWVRPGRVELLETEYHPDGLLAPRRMLSVIAASLPFLQSWPGNHAAYAAAGVESVLGDKLDAARVLKATTLSSMLFLNDGLGRFRPRPLPDQVQWAPVFGLQVSDFDGDSHEDVVVCQNFSHVREAFPDQDQGRGLILLGNGDGTFRVLEDRASGVSVHGDMRGVALADFDQDHRMDFVMTQQEGSTRLFLNRAPSIQPGWQIEIKGHDDNPAGYGCQVRFAYPEGRLGPVREVQAGSGWWSQNSPVMVMHPSREPASIWIRWPGGETHHYPLKPGQNKLVLRPGGSLGSDPAAGGAYSNH
ncbi:FG-GAP-like repeat-containing protein [Verrucomicrobia bacterium]|nr:FG-GAP-like repeat-containing protein [Verrucomicrobiota bacterium]